MATIKEMAEIHAPITKDDTWDKIRKQILKQTSFEAGANAVLVVIEDSLAEFNNTEDYSILQRKIKELKGE